MSESIGALRARVRLESPARDEDDLGGAVLTWSDQGAVWAEIEAQGGAQGADFDAAPSVATYRVRIRSRADVRAGWRVTWGARALSVVAVRDDGASRIELDCEEEHL